MDLCVQKFIYCCCLCRINKWKWKFSNGKLNIEWGKWEKWTQENIIIQSSFCCYFILNKTYSFHYHYSYYFVLEHKGPVIYVTWNFCCCTLLHKIKKSYRVVFSSCFLNGIFPVLFWTLLKNCGLTVLNLLTYADIFCFLFNPFCSTIFCLCGPCNKFQCAARILMWKTITTRRISQQFLVSHLCWERR